MRTSVTSSFRPGACLAKPVQDADAASSEQPATTMSISSTPNTPGGPGAKRLASSVALNRSPFCSQWPVYANVLSPPLSVPLAPNVTTPAPSPTGVLNQTEYLPSVINRLLPSQAYRACDPVAKAASVNGPFMAVSPSLAVRPASRLSPVLASSGSLPSDWAQ